MFEYIILEEKICPQCKNSFKPKRKNQICCSAPCSHNYIVTENFKISISKSCKGKNGGFRENSGRGIQTWYFSPIAGKVHLQSSWELKYAEYLDANNILWKRNTERFYYLDDKGQRRYYVPDFYLIQENEYIEIKGFKTSLDEYKWRGIQNLKVLYKKDLKNLKIL